MKKRDFIMIIGGLAFIALIVSLSLLIGNQLKPQACGCPKVISQNFLWLFIALAIIFVGSLLYYLFSLKMDTQRKVISKNKEILYTILDDDEKFVIKKLVESKGEIQQSEISEKFDKIKAHRVIKKLIDKKIIDVVKEGKTNKVILKKELREELI